MLRARFVSGESSHYWRQRIELNLSASYYISICSVSDIEGLSSVAQASEKSLDIHIDPVFAADLINMPSGQRVLFMVALYLVVDFIS